MGANCLLHMVMNLYSHFLYCVHKVLINSPMHAHGDTIIALTREKYAHLGDMNLLSANC